MIKTILLITLINQLAFAANYPLSRAGTNHLPFNSKVRLCSVAFGSEPLHPVIQKGDLAVLRVDVSFLLKLKQKDPSDFDRLSKPYNFFKTHFKESSQLKLLTQDSRIYGPPGSQKMEYIYLVKAEQTGETEFSAGRTYRVQVGQHEMGTHELVVLNFIASFRDMLIETLDADAISFSDYMEQKLPNATEMSKRLFKEMGNGEENNSLNKRVELANQRIESWQRSLAPPIMGDHHIKGNIYPLTVSSQGRENVFDNQIHQIKHNQIPGTLTVKQGDLITVETVRPGEIVGDNYAHRYSTPDLLENGLYRISGETIEQALLGNDHGTNRAKTYFLAESAGKASIRISKPKISHPYTPHQKDVWVKTIEVTIEP